MGWSTVVLAWVLAATRPGLALAPLDVCGVVGEYVLSASVVRGLAPGHLTGTFTFAPPEGCGTAEGAVAIAVVHTATSGLAVPYQVTLPYAVVGEVVVIGAGVLTAQASEEPEDAAGSLTLTGSPGLVVAGTLQRRQQPADRRAVARWGRRGQSEWPDLRAK